MPTAKEIRIAGRYVANNKVRRRFYNASLILNVKICQLGRCTIQEG